MSSRYQRAVGRCGYEPEREGGGQHAQQMDLALGFTAFLIERLAAFGYNSFDSHGVIWLGACILMERGKLGGVSVCKGQPDTPGRGGFEPGKLLLA